MSPKIAKAVSVRKPAARYALLRNELLTRPPIQHSGRDNNLLTPSEMHFVGGIIIAARRDALPEHRHKQAYAAGRDTIDNENEDADRFLAQWQRRDRTGEGAAPVRLHTFDRSAKPIFKPVPRHEALGKAGRYGYAKSREHYRAPDVITVGISRRALLALSDLSDTGDNWRALPKALDRLTEPFDGFEVPLLRNWAPLADGVRLRVNGYWLPSGGYKKVLWHLPKYSAAALALYLHTHVLDTRQSNKQTVKVETLARKLGLPTRQPKRALRQAVEVVNKTLVTIPDAVIRELLEGKRSIPPASYDIEYMAHGQCRVVRTNRADRYVAAEDEERPTGSLAPRFAKPKPRIRRYVMAAERATRVVGIMANLNVKVDEYYREKDRRQRSVKRLQRLLRERGVF